jgi:hypothetical protein
MKTSFEVLVTPGAKSGMEGAVPNTIRAISRFDMLFWPRSVREKKCEAHLHDAHPRSPAWTRIQMEVRTAISRLYELPNP